MRDRNARTSRIAEVVEEPQLILKSCNLISEVLNEKSKNLSRINPSQLALHFRRFSTQPIPRCDSTRQAVRSTRV